MLEKNEKIDGWEVVCTIIDERGGERDFTTQNLGLDLPQTVTEGVSELLADNYPVTWGDGGLKESDASVDLIASGYEWICPECHESNEEVEITESVKCAHCNTKFNQTDHEHAIG